MSITHTIAVQDQGSGCTVTYDTHHCANFYELVSGAFVFQQCAGGAPFGDSLVSFPGGPQPFAQVCGLIQDIYGAVSSGTLQVTGQGAGQITDLLPITAIEDCFWKTYRQCSQASTTLAVLLYHAELSAGGAFHTLAVNADKGVCWVTHNGYSCADVEQVTGGGLVAQGCGAEGDVIIPKASPGYS
jgi:hypothetical protein